MMSWRRCSRIFTASDDYPWMRTHAANPVPVSIGDNLYRIYFSCRDDKNRSHVAFVEIDIEEPNKIKGLSNTPVLAPGSQGHFDDSGVTIGCIVTVNQQSFLYYIGWNLGVTVPFRNSIGLAIAEPGSDHFEKFKSVPIVDRSDHDPVNLSYPFVLKDRDIYRMWYGSNLQTGETTEDMRHGIKYAESKDGIEWRRDNIICIGPEHAREVGAARPCVLKQAGKYTMWYSFRFVNEGYQIGYAESEDGITWHRLDDSVCFIGAEQDWDCEMRCYPYVFEHGSKLYMLYCGNDYGRSGFGLAELEDSPQV